LLATRAGPFETIARLRIFEAPVFERSPRADTYERMNKEGRQHGGLLFEKRAKVQRSTPAVTPNVGNPTKHQHKIHSPLLAALM
jgi:hypothetical protein